MEQSGIDFTNKLGVQLLCVDNQKVRDRIQNNNNIDITIVPCILTIYANGGVEKYDGAFAFDWVKDIVDKLMQAQAQQQAQAQAQQAQAQQAQVQAQQQAQQAQVQAQQQAQAQKPQPQPQPQQTGIQTNPSVSPSVRSRENFEQTVPDRMQRIGETSIDDIIFDDDETDRHKIVPPPPRIRQDENSYIEDETLFSGEVESNRKTPVNAIRSTQGPRQVEDPHGTSAIAKELARQRAMDETQINKQSQRPIEQRRL